MAQPDGQFHRLPVRPLPVIRYGRTPGKLYCQSVSSDPFTDLARTLGTFAEGLRTLLDANKAPSPGSPVDKEAAQETFAGEWGDHPSRDSFAPVLLTSFSCADHLAAAAEAIRTRHIIASPFTLIRSAAEAAGTACYVSERGIDPLERIRRSMNWRLDGLCQDIVMVRDFGIPGAAVKVAHLNSRIEAISRAGQSHGLTFKKAAKYTSAHLGDATPAAMTLIDQCASRTPGLGVTYQRLLSSVAHAKAHGIMRFLVRGTLIESDQPGQVLAPLNISAQDLARHLLIGPLCASTVVEHLGWFAGWDTDDICSLVIRMLHTWGRIAGVPYPGPGL
jgi:hypothetical protein